MWETIFSRTRGTLTVIAAALLAGCMSIPAVLSSDAAELEPGQRSRGAPNAILGSVGEKRREEGSWFERQRVPQWKSVAVHTASVVSINKATQVRLGELGVTADALTQAKIKAGWNETDEAKLTTLQIMDPSALAEEIETQVKTDPKLASILSLDNARIVTSVTTIVDHKLASELDASLDVKASVSKLTGADDVAVSLDIGGARKRQIKIGDGTVILYRLARLCWSPDRKLVALRIDYEKKSDPCPPGTGDRLPASPQ